LSVQHKRDEYRELNNEQNTVTTTTPMVLSTAQNSDVSVISASKHHDLQILLSRIQTLTDTPVGGFHDGLEGTHSAAY